MLWVAVPVFRTRGAGGTFMWALTRARSLPLRTKIVATLAGATALFLAASSLVALRFSEQQALQAAADQARTSAATIRSALELSLRRGDLEDARTRLREFSSDGSMLSVRVYDTGGHVVLSSDEAELGRERGPVWIPPWAEIPPAGLLRESADGRSFISYQAIDSASRHVLEANFNVAPMRDAMRRAARTVVALFAASVLALALVVLTMFEREVVAPVQRLDKLLASGEARPSSRDEFSRIHASVNRLVHEEQRNVARAGLAEVGQLAAEMAHEFKRPLAYVHSALDVLRMEYRIDDQEKKLVENIELQLDKVQETMRDLLALAKPLAPNREPVDLPSLLDDALLQLSGHPNAQRVSVRRDYEDHARQVLGDRHRLEQAFGNLLLNAVEAMPDGGELYLGTHRNGDHQVLIEIRDHGVGMDESELAQALRPFHSTKATGTGLGLPLVQRIVSAHEGTLELSSQRGVGTTARVWLRAPGEANS